MENLINSIGGYNSWQFAALSFGSLALGLILRIKWVYTIPIPAFGVFLMYLYLNHQYEITKVSISDPTASGFASIIPILFVAISIFVLVDPSVVSRMFWIYRGKPTGDKKK